MLKHLWKTLIVAALPLCIGCSAAAETPEHAQKAPPVDARKSWTQKEGSEPVFFQVQPERSGEETDQARREIPPVHYQPPADRWNLMPLSREILAHKEPQKDSTWRVVMLGDSIINDTRRNRFAEHVRAKIPNTPLELTAVLGGGKGCWWYVPEHRVERFVVPLKPDLLIIGGISHRNDIDAVRNVIHTVRTAKKCDVLLMTGPFGELDPLADDAWRKERAERPDAWHVKLAALANEEKAAFLDVQLIWGDYIRGSGKKTDWFHRDQIHANPRGEAILAEILGPYLSP